MKTSIHTRNAPAAIGPYSQAVEQNGLVFCSGQIALDPASGALVEGGIEFETRRVLQNLGHANLRRRSERVSSRQFRATDRRVAQVVRELDWACDNSYVGQD